MLSFGQQRLSFPFNHYKLSFTDTFSQEYCCLKATDNFQRLTTSITTLPILFLGFKFDALGFQLQTWWRKWSSHHTSFFFFWDETFSWHGAFLVWETAAKFPILWHFWHCVSRWATSIIIEMPFFATPVTPAFPSATLVLVSDLLLIDAIYLLFFAKHIAFIWISTASKERSISCSFAIVKLVPFINSFPRNSDDRHLSMTWSRIGSSAFSQLQF